jgi:lipoate-protein ligase A
MLFENNSTKAAFYFAAEEYIMMHYRPQEAALMVWSTDDTVMIGANQVAEAESDGDYAKSVGIEIIRRPSGGGAIFTDPGTLQYTVILPYRTGDDAKSFVRDWLAGPVIETLACFGAGVSIEGRNDIVIEGKKIAGIAQYIKNGYLCSHGSLLFNTDIAKLARVLTVDREKIKTKAIASVDARVTNITDYIDEKDIRNFREAFIESFEHEGVVRRKAFKPDELEKIGTIRRERFENPDWTYGHGPAYTTKKKKRFPGGGLEISLDIKGGAIQNIRINGDYMALRPIVALEEALKGAAYREDRVLTALKGVDVKLCLGSLGEKELMETLFS